MVLRPVHEVFAQNPSCAVCSSHWGGRAPHTEPKEQSKKAEWLVYHEVVAHLR